MKYLLLKKSQEGVGRRKKFRNWTYLISKEPNYQRMGDYFILDGRKREKSRGDLVSETTFGMEGEAKRGFDRSCIKGEEGGRGVVVYINSQESRNQKSSRFNFQKITATGATISESGGGGKWNSAEISRRVVDMGKEKMRDSWKQTSSQ